MQQHLGNMPETDRKNSKKSGIDVPFDESDIQILSDGDNNAAPAGEGDVLLIRERTFTPDLRKLVNKVTGQGTGRKRERPAFDTTLSPLTSDISDEELLKKYHSLFYHTLHFKDRGHAGRGCLSSALHAGLDDTSLNQIITDELSKISSNGFSLLSYSIPKKSYIAFINTITDFDVTRIFLSLNDDLSRRIQVSREGVVVSADDIDRDPLFRKYFRHLRLPVNCRIYLNFYHNFYKDLPGLPAAQLNNAASPLMIVKIQLEDSVHDVYTQIQSSISSCLLLYAAGQVRLFQESGTDSFENLFRIIELYYSIFRKRETGIILKITVDIKASLEYRYILSYLMLKLEFSMSGSSMVCQPDRDKLLIFCAGSDIKPAENILNEYNRSADGCLHVLRLTDVGEMEYIQFLERYVF